MKSEDVAKIAGVSRSTVSRVINGYQNVPDETREKVMRVINELGYEPNTFARTLAGKSNNTIGLFVMSYYNSNHIYRSSYFSTIVNAALDISNSSGYYVLIHTIFSQEDYYKVSQCFLQKRVGGGILVGNQKDTAMLKTLLDTGMPIGIVDHDASAIIENGLGKKNLSIINSDDYSGAAAAVEYLVSLGHTDIGFIEGRLETFSGLRRQEGFFDTAKKLGINIRQRNILKGNFLYDDAFFAVTNLAKSGDMPTAIIAANDDMAIAAMAALKEQGINVPQQISIMGFDDIPLASQLTPALTTMSIPLYDMVAKVTGKIIEKIESGSDRYTNEVSPVQLIERDSCKAI